MIKKETPLSMPEALEYLKSDEAKEMKAFVKKFTSIDEKTAKQLREKIVALELIKLNEKHISKIIDLLPENKEVLNGLLQDVNLDENESNVILQTIKDTI